ncbi:DUF3298 and DUF4163 domain-containing protein [Microbulbifer sp. ALW1]|uniref:DUF3298 and DUF4163 domain-containing protein n=1 Tax=Microbulbifer sp. (strain ALW1) TaxID=1516059 RepID=UPI001356E347|nr:DUF3298 and DUF4163 domain-containing protein [Microbulbifer sp. ALW1]
MSNSTTAKYVYRLLGITVVLCLVACDNQQSVEAGPLKSEIVTLEERAPDCTQPEECASVSITREVFVQRSELNDAARKQLLTQLQGFGEAGKENTSASLEQVAEDFLAEAAQVADISSAHWQLSGAVKSLARRGDLLTLEISSYLFTGGAHGMPATQWMNWDLAQNAPVTLADVIKPGKEGDFWKQAEAAHQQWQDEQSVDEEFRENWPFARTDDFRMTDNGLHLLYGVYTLGPYSMGQVELTLPQEKLTEILREPYQ